MTFLILSAGKSFDSSLSLIVLANLLSGTNDSILEQASLNFRSFFGEITTNGFLKFLRSYLLKTWK